MDGVAFDYVDALSLYRSISPTAGQMVLEAEGLALYRAAHECGAGSTLIEIGSYQGTSTAMLARGMNPSSILFAIDPHEGHLDTTSPRVGESPSIEGLWRTLRRAEVQNRVAIIAATSRAAYSLLREVLPHLRPGLLFVDGSHLAEDVYSDLQLYAGWIRDGGFIILDDLGYETVRAGFERWRAGAPTISPVDLRAWGLEDPVHNRLHEGAVGKMTFFRKST
jgi:predicted O-methyltransferase YrrM